MQDSKKRLFARRRLRYQKLAKLRAKYKASSNDTERVKVLEKVHKLAPWLKQEEFVKSTVSA